MLYSFSCRTCERRHEFSFLMSQYDQHVHNENNELDGCHRTELCEKCKTKTLYRHISADTMPMAGGGTNGYMSMDRYWAQNPGEQRRKEDALAKTLAQRHADRVTSRIDKQQERQGSDKRRKGYGKGQGEQRLNSD